MSAGIYEHPVWTETSEGSMHPGGVELTCHLLEGCDLKAQSRILDLGCGVGQSMTVLSEEALTWYGMDHSLHLLQHARRNLADPWLSQAQAERLPLADASLDAILCECTLSLFELPAALRECARVIKPRGWLIVSDLYARNPNGIQALGALPVQSCVSRARLREDYESLVCQNGFEIISWEDHSQALRSFPVCKLLASSQIDRFDLYIVAAQARLGYFSMLARKEL